MRKAALLCVAVVVAAVVMVGCELVADRPARTPTQAISNLALSTGQTGTAVTEKHFVMDWLMLGPITFKEADFGGDHQQPSADQEFVKNEGRLDGTQTPPEGAKWQENRFASVQGDGRVALDAFYSGADHVAAYAVAWLKCPAPLYVGSDDYLKIWINGKRVHTYKTERRAGEADQDCVTGISLKQGYNRVVVKCVDVILGWNFYFRLTDAKDRPIAVKAAAKTG